MNIEQPDWRAQTIAMSSGPAMAERGLSRAAQAFDALDPTVRAVTKQLTTDTYVSFYFAQTDNDAQQALLTLCGDQYQRTMTEVQLALLPDALTAARSILPRVVMPVFHGPVSISRKREDDKQSMLGELDHFIGVLADAASQPPLDEAAAGAHAYKASRAMLSRDRHYVRRGRPDNVPGLDRHRSILRTHVLLQEPSGSSTHDALTPALLDACFTGDENRALFDELAYVWEQTHPGEVFYASDRPQYPYTPPERPPAGAVTVDNTELWEGVTLEDLRVAVLEEEDGPR